MLPMIATSTGSAAPSRSSVAGDAGVNIATLHYYFPTKEALIRGVIGHAMQRFAATIPSQGSGLEQLQGHLRALSRLIKDDQQLRPLLGSSAIRSFRSSPRLSSM